LEILEPGFVFLFHYEWEERDIVVLRTVSLSSQSCEILKMNLEAKSRMNDKHTG
jgi:hypothetical protein